MVRYWRNGGCGILGAMKFPLTLITILLISGGYGAADPVKKKLIEFGWDEPDTVYLRQHAEEMQKRPLDGVVFTLRNVSRDGKKKTDYLWSGWGPRVVEDWQFKESLEDLKATKFSTF